MSNLKEALFVEYNGYADKRIRDQSGDHPFVIDDRSEKDVGANRKLFSYFCQMFAQVNSDGSVRVTLRGNVPESEELSELFDSIALGSRERETAFDVANGEQDILNKLSRALRKIVAPGKRYSEKNYKYVCPRTAKSLQRLKTVLDKVWTKV